MIKLNILTMALVLIMHAGFGQKYVTRDIKSFGAKGDGKTNDHAAFQKAAAFFNQRKGNGKLTISKGIYIVGKQVLSAGSVTSPVYAGEDVLHFTKIQNMSIEGTASTILKYANGLHFGAFDPKTGKSADHGNTYFINESYKAVIGTCIFLDNCERVTIARLDLNGNNQNVDLGASYGDVGRQLPYNGVFIQNSRAITVDGIKAHHFGLDGICVANVASESKDQIKILNSSFEYNSRQGFSWVGGNDLLVKNCKFNHTGKSKFYSPPGAGVDIEAEYGPIRNGVFESCEFINNAGCGMVADSGDSGNCSFNNCTFWGVDAWSIWTKKPGFTFTGCKIYGSIVHGYSADNDKDATKFNKCVFEDKAYMGKEVYGRFLIETNSVRRMSFTNCTMIAHKKKLCWFDPGGDAPLDEKYLLVNCRLILKKGNIPADRWPGIIRGVRYKDTIFEFEDGDLAKKNGYYFGEAWNKDLGGNKWVFK